MNKLGLGLLFLSGCVELGADQTTAPPPESCRSWCGVGAGACSKPPTEGFDDLETTAAAWREEIEQCSPTYVGTAYLYAGQCQNDVLFLHRDEPLRHLVHFFDASSGEFLALRDQGDGIDPVCLGLAYWPRPIECQNPTVTLALVGNSYEPGDPIELPNQEYHCPANPDACFWERLDP